MTRARFVFVHACDDAVAGSTDSMNGFCTHMSCTESLIFHVDRLFSNCAAVA